MEHLETGSVVLAVLSSIWAIVGVALLFSRKLRPVGRQYPDRPQLWVPVGFYSYTFIHWMMVYGYWTASHFPEPDADISFHAISHGTTQMATNSLNQLKDVGGIKISMPILKMTQDAVAKEIAAGLKLKDRFATINDFDSKIKATQSLLQSFGIWFGNLADGTCKDDIQGVFIPTKFEVEAVSKSVEVIQSQSYDEEKLKSISGKVIGIFNEEKLSVLGNEKINQIVNEKKELLTHFIVDMSKMDVNGKKIVKKLVPLIPNKISWIHQVTYWEIFVTLIISFFILIGFGRLEPFMSVRWPTRLTAFSIPLAALNIIFFAVFIGLMASFECPKEAEKIDLDRFTTTWKSRLSNSPPSKLCSSGRTTFFSGIDDRISIEKDQIASLLKNDIERTIGIGDMKIGSEILSENMKNLKIIVNQTRTIGEVSCLGEPESLKLAEIVDTMDKFLEECASFEKDMSNFDANLELGTANLKALLSSFYEDARESVEHAIEEAKVKVNSADISCDVMKWRVKECQKMICSHLDVQLNELWLVLDVVMVFLVALFCLNIVVYRTIALWEMEFHGPTPPPPQPVARVLRRHRPRRLAMHVF